MKRNAVELYRDSRGLPFANIRAAFAVMGKNPQEFPLNKVTDDALISSMHQENDHCWRCGVKTICEHIHRDPDIHHVIKQRKSDERTNLLYLCAVCHRDCHLSSKFTMGEQLWLLWSRAHEHLDWMRLCVLQRHYLMDEPTEPRREA